MSYDQDPTREEVFEHLTERKQERETVLDDNVQWILPHELKDGMTVLIVVPGDEGGILVRAFYSVSTRNKGRLILKPIKKGEKANGRKVSTKSS